MATIKQIVKNNIPVRFVIAVRKFKKKKEIKSLFGNKVTCPVCNYSFKKFASYGVPVRENAKCPFCGSFERHRLLWRYLKDKTDLFNPNIPKKILHFAPERFFHETFSLQKNTAYYPCDLNSEKYDLPGKIKVLKVDVTNIPFETNTFDIVLCNHVLEHIPDDKKAMCEIYRVMKKGGWGILQVPINYNLATTYEDWSITSAEEREKAFGQSDHVRWYGLDYKNRLENAGFEVHVDDYAKKMTESEIEKFGIIRNELIYHCRKI